MARGEVKNLLARLSSNLAERPSAAAPRPPLAAARAVWAMDHTEPATPRRWPVPLRAEHPRPGQRHATRLAAHGRRVRRAGRLHVGSPVSSIRAAAGTEVRQRLAFYRRGRSQLLERWKVFPLFSPPRTPEYNGSVEAGNGIMKVRATTRPPVRAAQGVGAAMIWRPRNGSPIMSFGLGANTARRGRGLGPAVANRAEERAAFGRLLADHREAVRLATNPLGRNPGPSGPGQSRSCGYPPRSRRARHPYFHPEVNYSTSYGSICCQNFVASTPNVALLPESNIGRNNVYWVFYADTTLMYRPAGVDSIYVSLQLVQWGFWGTAKYYAARRLVPGPAEVRNGNTFDTWWMHPAVATSDLPTSVGDQDYTIWG